MLTSLKAVALLLYLSFEGVFAAPFSSNGGSSFSIPANFNGKLREARLHSIRQKNHRNADSTLSKRQDSSPVANYNRGIYVTPVALGGNQILNLHLDTSSADLWVFSTLLDDSSRNGHTVYDSTQSQTYQHQDGSFDVSYGDGSRASGDVGTETVLIGGTTVEGQWFGLASLISEGMQAAPDDGIVGLAFSDPLNTIQPNRQQTFFEKAIPSLTKPLFTAYLPKNANGAYTFGTIDASKYTGAINYAPVDKTNGYWEFDTTSYKVGDTQYDSPGTTGFADIASSFILMQDDQVNNFYADVDNSDDTSGEWLFPCNADLPTLSFLIGPNTYATIPAKYLIYEATDSSKTVCVGSLQSLAAFTDNSPYNVYGIPFFNAYYGVFNASAPQFGFAPCINC